MPEIKLFNSDCLEVLKTIPDESIDLILQDPPYNTTACKWEWDIMTKIDEFWDEWKRVIKGDGAIVMTSSQPFTSKLVCSNPKMFKYEWIWEKSKASNFLQASYMPLKCHENILVFCKNGKTKYNSQMTQGKPYSGEKRAGKKGSNSDTVNNVPNPSFRRGSPDGKRKPRTVQYFKTSESEGKTIHPTQKPVALMEYLIKTYTDEGDVVFDGFMGSGTTVVAAKKINRSAIGVELDFNYFQKAKQRIDNA